ncbi:MAG: DM13 domain-containing protein [Nitrospirae bacterium]|nr:DM13 domain-containing protein [Nitrospirota bacterium]
MNRAHVVSTALIVIMLGVVTTAQSGMMKDEMKKGMMGGPMTMTASLSGAGSHHAAGTVSLTNNKGGSPMLLITDLTIDKVPDGRVYLAKDGDYTKGVELGKLTQFAGTVQYAIPANVNAADYNSVVIWCRKFSVEIGHAMFDGGMMKKDEVMKKDEMMKDGMMDKDMKK